MAAIRLIRKHPLVVSKKVANDFSFLRGHKAEVPAQFRAWPDASRRDLSVHRKNATLLRLSNGA
jgi:hypothetical protein